MTVRGYDKGTAAFLGAIAAARLALGGGMLVLPALSARLMGAEPKAAEASSWLARMVGGREFALGLVALAGATGRSDARWALLAQIAADSGDGATFAYGIHSGRLPQRPARGIAGFAAAAVVAEAIVAARASHEPLPG